MVPYSGKEIKLLEIQVYKGLQNANVKIIKNGKELYNFKKSLKFDGEINST